MLSVLEDMIPAKYRKYVVYLLIPLVVLIYGVWQASGGDWAAFWPALIPAVIGWLVAAPNTHPEEDDLAVPPYDPSDQPNPEALPVQPQPTQVAAAEGNAVSDESDALDAGVDYPTEEEM